ncbi:hypothetical protein [Nereida sp. MMG025]|uniref:hypothetical protein n=1 Tax=Nereida sp. MMG025 TaxID=2909981 RepID=UPI001F391C05|nr:hypothetical protein [Nereida sp. MMG025]MCF6444410.1 hypothetical protein [Nereida sp. MMG025]
MAKEKRQPYGRIAIATLIPISFIAFVAMLHFVGETRTGGPVEAPDNVFTYEFPERGAMPISETDLQTATSMQ